MTGGKRPRPNARSGRHAGDDARPHSGIRVARASSSEPGDSPDAAGPGAPEPRGRFARLGRALLRVPLFLKILAANAVIVTAGVIAGTVLASRYVRAAPDEALVGVVALLALAGVLISIGVNALILWIALKPLRALEEAASAVRSGDELARAPVPPVADRDLARLIRVFNDMLDQLADYRTRLRTIAARALNTAEDERKRIARELHDDTAQALANLVIRLRAARAARDEAERDRMLDEIRAEIRATVDRTRRFAQGLRPPALDMLGLVPAIQAHVRDLRSTAGLDVTMRADIVSGLLSPAAELALYRIVQEALSNVVRHARAEHAEVRIRRVGDRVIASVEDDGQGFSPASDAAAGEDRGLGILGMQERAGYVGGRFELRSEPGHGTRIDVEIPITGEERSARA